MEVGQNAREALNITSVHLLHIGSYLSKAVPASWIPSTLHIK